MPIKSFMYPAVRVDVVTLDPDQVVTHSRAVLDDVIGTIYVQGTILPADDRTWPAIVNHVWRPRLSWDTWKTAEGPAETTIKAGPEGCQSVCLSRTRGQGRNVQHIALDGSAPIPAGWGVVVAYGTAIIGGQQGEQGNYFAPRDEDREVTGSGDLLLVR